MQTFHGYQRLEPEHRGAVIALGNFDGVHLGHRAVLDIARRLASDGDAKLGVALFEPHPRRYFAPDARAFRLMSPARRDATLDALGIAQLHVLEFDEAMAKMSPEGFVQTVLDDGLGIGGIVTGSDFRFGAGRAGSTVELAQLCTARGIRSEFAELTGNGSDKVSSTRIRKAIHDGNMQAAAELLGTRWTVDGCVAQGNQRGRTIGFPTANIDMGDYVRPAYGVYAVLVGIDGEPASRAAVANIGKRPTVDGVTEVLEVHLLDFEGDLYGRELAIEFHDHLRAEHRFDGLDALKAQIALDAARARDVLTRVAGPA
ncbi:bifunctional riboflavin kinase/FAD synthetase [Maricaulis salignorans]|uniref:Riboflavin biosynthesis protein n=1 Tax=Maricaulis salignorans TaxID=144026 RepID=A0A1G9S466_9PROT|nr:bifunctional riboflavin kinase/FAD synthetase [Maricaulis salignorans]SDM30191.1 riboflavin kinase / FMN adenylyltransferase [Maricaulis salignorans]